MNDKQEQNWKRELTGVVWNNPGLLECEKKAVEYFSTLSDTEMIYAQKMVKNCRDALGKVKSPNKDIDTMTYVSLIEEGRKELCTRLYGTIELTKKEIIKDIEKHISSIGDKHNVIITIPDKNNDKIAKVKEIAEFIGSIMDEGRDFHWENMNNIYSITNNLRVNSPSRD